MGAGATPAGWYPDVERPGGERYWDGSLWTEQRRNVGDPSPGPASAPSAFEQQPPAFGQQPPAYGQQPPGYGQPSGGFGQQNPQPAFGSPAGYTPYGASGSSYPPSTTAGWSLGLSIAGLVCGCVFFLSVVGLILGWQHMKAVDAGGKDPATRGLAKAGFIVGIVGTAIYGSVFMLYMVLFVVSAAAA